MSGIHTIYRKSTGTNFVEVESKIYLPTKCGCRENSPVNSGYNGAFPEFFHGFYKGSSYGLDIGIMYRNGSYRLFFYSYKNTQSTQWFTSSQTFNIGDTYESRLFTLKSNFQNGYLVTRCYNSNGTLVASLDVFLEPAAYASMSQGCTINREMCLALNKNSAGEYTVPAPCYFSPAKWTQTKMKTASGTVVAMTNSNTTTQHGKKDNGTPTKTYLSSDPVCVMEGGYMADVGSASFSEAAYVPQPIS